MINHNPILLPNTSITLAVMGLTLPEQATVNPLKPEPVALKSESAATKPTVDALKAESDTRIIKRKIHARYYERIVKINVEHDPQIIKLKAERDARIVEIKAKYDAQIIKHQSRG